MCCEQRRRVVECTCAIELGDAQLFKGFLSLSEVESCTALRDGELNTDFGVELRRVDRACQLECLLRARKATLAVDHEWNLIVIAGDATVGAQLTQGKCEVTGRVRSDAQRLADDSDASRGSGCGERVLVR